MNLLAGGAVAVFRVQRLFPTELVMNPSAVTASFVTGMEVCIVLVHSIRSAEFPLIVLTVQGTIVPIISVLPILI